MAVISCRWVVLKWLNWLRWFLEWSLVEPVLHCVIRVFRFPENKGTPVNLTPDSGFRLFRVATDIVSQMRQKLVTLSTPFHLRHLSVIILDADDNYDSFTVFFIVSRCTELTWENFWMIQSAAQFLCDSFSLCGMTCLRHVSRVNRLLDPTIACIFLETLWSGGAVSVLCQRLSSLQSAWPLSANIARHRHLLFGVSCSTQSLMWLLFIVKMWLFAALLSCMECRIDIAAKVDRRKRG